jgi:hypothetical protein
MYWDVRGFSIEEIARILAISQSFVTNLVQSPLYKECRNRAVDALWQFIAGEPVHPVMQTAANTLTKSVEELVAYCQATEAEATSLRRETLLVVE